MRYSVATSVVGLGVVLAAATAHAGGFDRAIERALPRVVKLYGLGAGMQKGFGSGVLVSEDGLVLTVYSLLIDADTVRAVMNDGTRYGARVIFHDRNRQLSLLRLAPLNATGGNRFGVSGRVFTRGDDGGIAIGRAAEAALGPFAYFDIRCDAAGGPSTELCAAPLRPGEWVVAAGNAFKIADGDEPVSIAHGVFSARTRLDARRRLRDFPYHGDVLVIDAITSNPGAPGSAMVNLDGAFVGMIGREVVSNLTHTHFNYAIPRDVLADFLEEALAAEKTGRFLADSTREKKTESVDPGIRITRAGFRTVLPFVERVVRGSPADRMGIRKDDLVLSVNGRNISNVDEYYEELARIPEGETINIVLRRERRIITVQIGVPKRKGG